MTEGRGEEPMIEPRAEPMIEARAELPLTEARGEEPLLGEPNDCLGDDPL